MSLAPARQWSAFLPLAMSIAGLALVLGHVAVSGAGPEADEGTAARLWWLLMGAQLLIAAWFAIMWLSRVPRMAALRRVAPTSSVRRWSAENESDNQHTWADRLWGLLRDYRARDVRRLRK